MTSINITCVHMALVAIILSICQLPSFIRAEGDDIKVGDFGYEALDGPTKWATLSPANALCDTGKQQSPVNFAKTDIRPSSGLLPMDFSFPSLTHFKVSNDKHTIQFTPLDQEQQQQQDAPVGTRNQPTPRGMTLADGRRYTLQQMHIHTPSEHRMDRVAYAGEFHLVHESADGRIAVVAVFIDETSGDNPAWNQVVRHLPTQPDTSVILTSLLDTSHFVQATQAGVFTYQGSLTTPPCTEGVSWFVLATPISMSPAQLRAFKQLIGFSARPTMLNINVMSPPASTRRQSYPSRHGESESVDTPTPDVDCLSFSPDSDSPLPDYVSTASSSSVSASQSSSVEAAALNSSPSINQDSSISSSSSSENAVSSAHAAGPMPHTGWVAATAAAAMVFIVLVV